MLLKKVMNDLEHSGWTGSQNIPLWCGYIHSCYLAAAIRVLTQNYYKNLNTAIVSLTSKWFASEVVGDMLYRVKAYRLAH